LASSAELRNDVAATSELDARSGVSERAQKGETLPRAVLIHVHILSAAHKQVVGQPKRVQSYLLSQLRHRLEVAVAGCEPFV